MKKFLSLILFFVCVPALAQMQRIDIPLWTTGPTQPTSAGALPIVLAIPGTTVSILNNTATSKITTYTDATGSTPCPTTTQLTSVGSTTCIGITDASSDIGFWYAGGSFSYTITTPQGQTYGPYLNGGSQGSGNVNPSQIGLTAAYNATGPTVSGYGPANAGAFANLAAAFGSGAASLVIPPGMTGNPPLQYNQMQAQAGCSVDYTTGSLTIYPLAFGSNYSITPTVAVTGGTGTTVATAVLGVGSQADKVVSYNIVSSTGYTPTSLGATICPATVTVAAPPAALTPVSSINLQPSIPSFGTFTGYSSITRVKDFGCAEDDVTDDSQCFANALYYASKGNTQAGAVSLTSQRTYKIGSFQGNYFGGFDSGAAPIAATLSITTNGSGQASGCSIVDGGTLLGSAATNTFTSPSGGSGGIAVTLNTTTHKVTACTGSGGSGYPISTTVTVYAGNTCLNGTQVPCQNLPPDTVPLIGIGVELPSFVTIYGNDAFIDGGFTSALEAGANYTYAYPYGAVLGCNRNTVGCIHVRIKDVNFVNSFIGEGNIGSYWENDGVTFSGALLAQGQNMQFTTWKNINVHVQPSQLALISCGGTWVDRAPNTGGNAAEVLNAYNLCDNMAIDNVQYFGPPNFASTAQYNQVRVAFNCWMDRTFFKKENQGVTDGQNCLVPPGGITRMTDQDIAAQVVPDDMQRDYFGQPIALYSRYGRAINGVYINNLICKGNLNYCVIMGPSNNADYENLITEEAGAQCQGGFFLGSDPVNCPNYYEPQNTVGVPSVILRSEPGTNAHNIFAVNGFQRPESLPFQLWSSAPLGNIPSSPAQIQSDASSSGSIFNRNPVNALGYVRNQIAGPYRYYQGTTEMPGDSIGVLISGRRSNGGTLRDDNWYYRVNNLTLPDSSPSVLEFLETLNNNFSNLGTAAVKFPGYAVRNTQLQGGNLTGVTAVTPGTGYINGVAYPCTIAASSVLIPNTAIAYTASCIAIGTSTGTVLVSLDNKGKGYTVAPTITIGPPTSGTTATFTTTINTLDKYTFIGDHYLSETFLSGGNITVAPGETKVLTGLLCGGTFFSSTNTSLTDTVTLISTGTTGGDGPLVKSAWVTASDTCTATLFNPSNATLTVNGGASGKPWIFQDLGAESVANATSSSPAISSQYLGNAALRGQTPSIGGSLISQGCTSFSTVTITGASNTIGVCIMSGVGGNPANIQPQCSVTSGNTITPQLCTGVSAGVTPTAQTYNILVF